MEPYIPEKDKKSGVFYVLSDDGLELPVIDLTHPSFALISDPQELSALTEAYYAQSRLNEKRSFLRNLFLKLIGRNSRFIQGLGAIAKKGYLDSLTTYLLKLPPDLLGRGYASKIDFRIAQSLPCLSVRLRLRDTVGLLEKEISLLLSQKSSAPLHLLNIGGGTCVDSWNVLLSLKKNHPGLLDRPIRLNSLDLGEEGFKFGVRALESLRAIGGPLEGLDVTFQHFAYDWRETQGLSRFLPSLGDKDVIAVSSEGALLEYGTDEEITANLRVLSNMGPKDLFLVGSVTRDHEATRPANKRFNLKPRNPENFANLVKNAGWSVANSIDAPLCYSVILKPKLMEAI